MRTSRGGPGEEFSARKRCPPASGDPGPPPTHSQFQDAVRIVEASGVTPVLAARIDTPSGRPRALTVRGYYVAALLSAIRHPHRAWVSDIAGMLNSMTDQQRRSLGIPSWPRKGAYKRTFYLFHKIAESSLEDARDG